MSEENKNNSLFKKIQNFIFKNYTQIIISLLILLILFIGLQTYNYFKVQDIKNSSVSFFDIIQDDQNDLSSLENLIDDDNIFSTLSKLKLIQQNNENKNFSYSNELYKELLTSSNLDDLYKSAIAAHASYTMINASYEENTNNYLNDILIYINNINDELDSYFSIKKELEYLSIVTEIDLNKSEYSNSKALDKYNEIFNSNLVSASTKERVKKIHEFQLYK
jgi:predicted negative regulator of RcsB-dependent stress response